MGHKIIVTEEGSHTLHHEKLDENYHSIHGSIQEGKKIFIESGLMKVERWKSPINILEVGFGTGLNALLTWLKVFEEGYKINYVGVEPFPVDLGILSELNYPQIINEKGAEKLYQSIISTSFDTPAKMDDNFSLMKIQQKIEDVPLRNGSFSLVYFDAFSPEKQPELWTESIFTKMYNIMEEDGILMTYSAKGEVKRNLQAAGFTVEKIEGPIGKREIIRAIKKLPEEEFESMLPKRDPHHHH